MENILDFDAAFFLEDESWSELEKTLDKMDAEYNQMIGNAVIELNTACTCEPLVMENYIWELNKLFPGSVEVFDNGGPTWGES